jgi:hypothetical protein
MAGKLPVPSEVDPQNIARPNVEQTFAEEQKALAEVRRNIREQKEREILELEEEAMKQYISHFSVDRQGNVKKDKDVIINIPTLSDAPPEANSDIANMIDGAVSASLNNKFIVMSENFESTITSRLDRIEAKFGKQFSSNDINASTSNTENSKDSTLDDFQICIYLKSPLVYLQSTTYIVVPVLVLPVTPDFRRETRCISYVCQDLVPHI